MTRTTGIFFCIALSFFIKTTAVAQSLTIINNSSCKLDYTLYGSENTPCGKECFVQATISSRDVKKYESPSSVKWGSHTEVYFWRAFALRYEGATVAGNCNSEPPFSGVVPIASCNIDVEYSWNVEEDGSITVVISPVVIPRHKTAWKLDVETIEGGVKFIIHPMVEVSHYVDISAEEKWMQKDAFRVRTNQKFIAAVYPLQAGYKGRMPVLATDKANLYNGYDACIVMPVSGNEKMVAMNCFCGTDQLFSVTYRSGAAQTPMVYSVTEP